MRLLECRLKIITVFKISVDEMEQTDVKLEE